MRWGWYAVLALLLSITASAQISGTSIVEGVIEDMATFYTGRDPQQCFAEGSTQGLCEAWGGRARLFRGRVRCIHQGILVDDSCLLIPQGRAIMTAITGIGRNGVGCLAEMGVASGDTILADRLRGHLDGSPRTQFCCDVRCASGIFPERSDTPGAMVFADTMGFHGEREGTVRILPRLLAEDAATMERVLFHELLHRIGVAVCVNHNMGNPEWVAAIENINAIHPSSDVPEGCSPRVGPLPTGTAVKVARDSGTRRCCLYRCGDREERCILDRFGMIEDDPIYACQRACYGVPTAFAGDRALCLGAGVVSEARGWDGSSIPRVCPSGSR